MVVDRLVGLLRAFAPLLVFAFAPFVSAQTGTIRGRVMDGDFDAPAPNVRVTIEQLKRSVLTSEQGNYVFHDVRPGSYTLRFTKDGMRRKIRPDVRVRPGRMATVNMTMTGDFTEMEEFVVQDILNVNSSDEASALIARFESPSIKDVVSSDLLSRVGLSNAADGLKAVAGASVKDGKSAVIRGLPDRYVSSQMNGMRLPTADEDKRAVELDQFPSSVINQIQVSKTFTPDQQGDASGGAVNVKLRGVPVDNFIFNVQAQTTHNTQATGRSNFLSYNGGGIHFSGKDQGDRAVQTSAIGGNWSGAVGVDRVPAPVDYKWTFALGGKQEWENGIEVGAYVNFFYERDSSYYDNGIDDSRWVPDPGQPMAPKTFQGKVLDGDFKTGLFDITKSEQSVQWGGLVTVGASTENHSLNLVYLETRTTEDKATLAEDTRGKEHFFPGHNPNDPTSPGHGDLDVDAAPYIRTETLEYTERTVNTLQFNGGHRFELHKKFAPEIDWTLAKSGADLDQPDKRIFGSEWRPARIVGPLNIPATHSGFKSAANFTLGNLQRIYKKISEDSEQYAASVKFPFELLEDAPGYLRLGVFRDKVERKFDQDTFSNFGDQSEFNGNFSQLWSAQFPFETHPITESLFDVDYDGELEVSASYAMLDFPIFDRLKIIGGFRLEKTKIDIVNDPEEFALWFPPGSLKGTLLNPGDADVTFDEEDVLPSISLVWEPVDELTVRAAFNKTIARQTFKELVPILQQEYLGGPIFIGNPGLGFSKLRNYDIRADWRPYDGALFSASYFLKKIDDPIEYVQRVADFDFTTAVNYPDGEIKGWEFEVRQKLGTWGWSALEGFQVGANATLIDSVVTLDPQEAAGFSQPNIAAPMETRDMTAAPEHLYNAFLTYDSEGTGTRFALFYTVQGDTLVAGAGESNGNFVPSLYQAELDTLNFTFSQRLGRFFELQFRAKNLTDATRKTVYRSPYIGADVTRASFTTGIEYSLILGSAIRF